MPSQDYVYIPDSQNSFSTSGSLVILVPAAYVEQHGLPAAQSLARRAHEMIVGFCRQIPSGLTSEQQTQFTTLIQAVLNNSVPAEPEPTLPQTLGEIMSLRPGTPPSDPSHGLPSNLTTLIYLDPDRNDVGTDSWVFQKNSVFDPSEPGATLIEMGTRYLDQMGEAGAPDLLKALMTAGLVASNQLDHAHEQSSRAMVERVREEMELPGIYHEGGDRFINRAHTDRVGLDREISVSLANGEVDDLTPGRVLARTRETENGLPLMRLELSGEWFSLTRPDSDVSVSVMRPELRMGDLRTQAYLTPELSMAQQILLDQFNAPGHGNMQDVIQAYNRALSTRLGPLGERYALQVAQGVDLGAFTLVRESDAPATYSDRGRFLIPYAQLISDAFEGALPQYTFNGRNQDPGRMVAVCQDEGDGMLERMGLLTGARPELRAFAFQLFFDAFQQRVAQGNIDHYKVVLGGSSEDVIYSVLTDDEVRTIHHWFQDTGNRDWLLDRFRRSGLMGQDAVMVRHYLDNVLETTTAQRLATGRAQLEVSGRTSRYSPVPDTTGRLVEHSHPAPESRRPFVIHNDRLYMVVEYRSPDCPLMEGFTHPVDWMSGDGAPILGGLVEGMPAVDDYALDASAFCESADLLLASWEDLDSPLDQTTMEQGLRRLLRAFPQEPAPRDSQGRLVSSCESWWNQCHRMAGEIVGWIRGAGLENNALVSTLDQHLQDQFGVDVDHPPRGYGRISFENGNFTTWRGQVTAEEMGLAPNWRPGMDIPGFNHEYGVNGSSRYTPTGEGGALGTAFNLAWTGESWPTPGWSAMVDASGPERVTVNAEDSSGSLRPLEVPEGGEWLDDTHMLWILGDENRISVVVNTETYADGSGLSLVRDFQRVLRLQALVEGSAAGRSYLSILQEGAAGSRSRYAQDAEINGVDAGLFEGLSPSAFVVVLGEGAEGVATLAPEVGDGKLRVMGMASSTGETSSSDVNIPSVMAYVLGIYEMRHGETLPTDLEMNDADYARAVRALAFEHQVARELGLPLRARLTIDRVEAYADTGGGVPLLDENFRPISPQTIRAINYLNQTLEAMVQTVEGAGVDMGDFEIDVTDPRESIQDIIDRADQDLPEGEARELALDRLEILARSAEVFNLEVIRLAREDVQGGAVLRQGVTDALPTLDAVWDQAREAYGQWSADMDRLSQAREVDPWVANILEREVTALVNGVRTVGEIREWMGEVSQPVRDAALSTLLEQYREDPDSDSLQETLASQDEALMDAWQRGSLSDTARQVMTLRMEQVRLGQESIPVDTRQVISSARIRYLLEVMAPPTETHNHLAADGQVQGEPMRVYDSQTDSLAQVRADRPDMEELLLHWRGAPEDTSVENMSPMEQVLAGQDFPAEWGIVEKTFLTRLYSNATGELEGVALAVKCRGNNRIKIIDLVVNPNGEAEVESETMLGIIQGIESAEPGCSIEITPSRAALASTACDLLFTSGDTPPLFSARTGSRAQAMENLGVFQQLYMEDAMAQMSSLVRWLPGSDGDEIWTALTACREEWGEYLRRGQGASPYYRLRGQLGELANEVIQGVGEENLNSEQLEYLDLLRRTSPQASSLENRAAYVEDSAPLVVVQLGEDAVTAQAARFLTDKHSSNAVRYRLAADGTLVLEDGTAVPLTGESKLILVGHGTADRVAGFTAGEVMDLLFDQHILSSGETLRRISVVACATDNPATIVEEGAPHSAFGEALIRAGENLGVTVNSVSSRSQLVMVDQGGRKWVGTPDAQGEGVTWHRGGTALKLVTARLPNGEFETTRVPVGQGLVESRPGTLAEALGPKPSRVISFIAGMPLNEDGVPMTSHGISSDDMARVHAILGEFPTGTIVFEGESIRVSFKATPEAITAAIEEASETVEDLYACDIDASELVDQYRRMAPVEREALLEVLLTKYAANPDSEDLRSGVVDLGREWSAYLENGNLSPEARLAGEIVMEQSRLQRLAGLDDASRPVSGEMFLSPEGARLALATTRPWSLEKLRVSLDDAGETVTVSDPVPGVAFTHGFYVLGEGSSSQESLPGDLKQDLIDQVNRWQTAAVGEDRERYARVGQILEENGVMVGDDALPTHVVVTRDPDGNIAALGIHSSDGQRVRENALVCDPQPGVADPPQGEYWMGADRANMEASLRAIAGQYPRAMVVVDTADGLVPRVAVNQYFTETRPFNVQLPGDEPSFQEAVRSLGQRKISFLRQALTELETASSSHVDAGERARLAGMRTLLRQANTHAQTATSLEDFAEVNGEIIQIRGEVAAASQSIRLAHDLPAHGFGPTITWVEDVYGTTSDAMHKSYVALVRVLETRGMVLPENLGDRPGTERDFQNLFTEVVDIGSQEDMAAARESIRSSVGANDLDVNLARRIIDYSESRVTVSEALVDRYVKGTIDLDGLNERYTNASAEVRDEILSALLEKWRTASDSADLRQALGRFNDEILDAYNGERLTNSARAVVDVQMEALRMADLSYHGLSGTFAMDLFLTPARTRLLLGSFERGNAQVEHHRSGLDPVLENLDDPWQVVHYSLSNHGNQAFIERFSDTPISAVRFDPQAHPELNLQLTEWCRRGGQLSGDDALLYNRLANAIDSRTGFADLHGRAADPYITVLLHPDSGKLMAVVLYSDEGVVLHENTTGLNNRRTVCIEGVLTPPPGDSPAELVPVNIQREALVATVAQINRRFPGSRISLRVNSTAEETQGRNLFFNGRQSDSLLISDSYRPTDFDAASHSLFERRMAVLDQSFAELETIAGGDSSRVNPHTHEAFQALRERFQGLRTRMSEDPAFWPGDGDVFIRHELEDLALRIYSEDPVRFRAHAGTGLEANRLAAVGRLDEGRAFFYTRVLNELPESFQSEYRNRPASEGAMGELISQMAQRLSPEEFAQALGPGLEYIRNNRLFMSVFYDFGVIWAAGQREWPEHAQAVKERNPALNDILFSPDELFYNHTRYDSQWVMGFNSDAPSTEGVVKLIAKNPESTRAFLWDGSRLVESGGEPVELGANSRLTIIGHGNPGRITVDDANGVRREFSGREFAQFVVDQNILAPGSRIARISFLSCNLGGKPPAEDTGVVREGFAHDFMEEMTRLGVRVDSLSLRNGYTRLDALGRRWVAELHEDGTVSWRHKGGLKLIISRNEDGELVYRKGDMDEDIAPIDVANPEDLPDGERLHFEDGVQTDGRGTPLEEGDSSRLTDDQMAVIRARYSEDYTGDLWVDPDDFPSEFDIPGGEENILPDPGLVTVETLQQSGQGETLARAGADASEVANSRLIRFKLGEPVDEFGLPMMPGGEGYPSDEELEQVREKYGTEFTGRVRLSPLRTLRENPGDLNELNPDLVRRLNLFEQQYSRYRSIAGRDLPQLDLNPEAIRSQLDPAVERAMNDSILTGKIQEIAELMPHEVRAGVNVRARARELANSIADAAAIRLEVERDHLRLMKAVTDRVQAYNEETGGDWVLDPESIVFEGDEIQFKVVPRASVEAVPGAVPGEEVRIPDSAQRVSFTVSTEGLIRSRAILESRKAQVEGLQRSAVDAEGRPRSSVVEQGVNHATTAAGIAMAGIGLLQAIRGLEEGNSWQADYGMATSAYFASHAGFGILAQMAKSSLGQAITRGASELAESAGRAAIQGIAMATGRTVEELTELTSEAVGTALRAGASVAGVLGEIIPYAGVAIGLVMIGMDAYNLLTAKTTLQRVQYGVDLVMDAALTVIDLIGAAFPPAQIVTAPLAIVVGVARMVFDSSIGHIWADIDALPPNADAADKIHAVLQGLGEGVIDLAKNLTPWGGMEEIDKLVKQHAKDEAYLTALGDPTTYFGVHPVDGVAGERAIDFQVGDNSMLGGGIDVVVGNPGEFSRVSVTGVPESILTGSEDHTLYTRTAHWQGVLPGNADYFILGLGESYNVQATESTAHMIWAIPVHSESVIAGMTANDQTLYGRYAGNDRDNFFIGPMASSFVYNPNARLPEGVTADERQKQLADMRATLSAYHYSLSGNGGNDTFIVGGGQVTMSGGQGADTYRIRENTDFTISNFGGNELDTLILDEIALENLLLGVTDADPATNFDADTHTPGMYDRAGAASHDLGIGHVDRNSGASINPDRTWYGRIINYLSSSDYRHLQLRTADGYLVNLDGANLADAHDQGDYFYTLEARDITAVYLEGRTGPDFDARNATVDALVGPTAIPDISYRTSALIPSIGNTSVRYNRLTLNHLEQFLGDSRSNTIHGNDGDNFIFGGGSSGTADILYGHGGRDTLRTGSGFTDISRLYGGAGDDTLMAMGGRARLEGGEGADRYILDGNCTNFSIHETADHAVNSIRLDIEYDRLSTSVSSDGRLRIQDYRGPSFDMVNLGYIYNWNTPGVNYEITTRDGWILGRNEDGGLSKIGFEGSTYAANLDAQVRASSITRGFQVAVDMATGSDITAQVSGINFEGGLPRRYKFDPAQAQAIMEWVVRHLRKQDPERFADTFVGQLAPVTESVEMARMIRQTIPLTGHPPDERDVSDIREYFLNLGDHMSATFFNSMGGTAQIAELSEFFGASEFSDTWINQARSMELSGYVWLEAGHHEFRLASSMNSRIQVDGVDVMAEGYGSVEEEGNQMMRYASLETQTAGYHLVELTYFNKDNQAVFRYDDMYRRHDQPEHYLKLCLRSNGGELRVLGHDDHAVVAQLSDLPDAMAERFANGDLRNGLTIGANFAGGNLVRISGTHEDDTLTGNALNNVLNGGAGADTLSGGEGADTYSLDGASIDRIQNQATDGLFDTAYLPFDASDISFVRIQTTDDLGIYRGDTAFGVVENWFAGAQYRHLLFRTRDNKVLRVHDSLDDDGNQVTVQAILNYADSNAGVTTALTTDPEGELILSLTGSDHNDSLSGNDYDNRIFGGGGNDTLNGVGGNDQLFGGEGDDILVGGDGTDSYILAPGDGANTIRNTQTGEEMNLLRIYGDKDDLTLTRSGDDLLIVTNGTGEDALSARVEDWFIDDSVRHLMIFTDDGYLLTPDHETESGTVPYTAMAMDLRHADSGQTVDLRRAPAMVKDVTGSRFGDRITGDDQDNLIAGGGGSDTLIGGGGRDTYVVDAGAGIVTIDNTDPDSAQDVVLMNMDPAAFSHTWVQFSDLVIETFVGTTIRLKDWNTNTKARDLMIMMNGHSYRLDDDGNRVLLNVDFSNHTQGQRFTLEAGVTGVRGTAFADALTGNGLDNHLDGGAGGMDTLSGRDGADVYEVDIDTITQGSSITSVAVAETEIQAMGGRWITVDDQGTDNKVNTLKLRQGDISELKSLRVGNDLYLYRGEVELADQRSDDNLILPAHAVIIRSWFTTAGARHMVVTDGHGQTAALLDDGALGPISVLDDSEADGVTRNLGSNALYRSVVKVSDSPGSDTYTGNDKDNVFTLTRGSVDRVTGGRGQDTYYVTNTSLWRQIILTNGGAAGQKDTIVVDAGSDLINYSGFGPDAVYFTLGNISFTLNLDTPFDSGSGFNPAFDPDSRSGEAPFLLATNDGYTFRVMNSGRLVADTVDISDQTTEVLDLATLSAPDLETNFNLPGNQRLFYYGPDSAWGAVTLKGGVHTRLLGGDDGANNLIVLETREAGVTLRGDGGSDTYMVGNTGTYVINNQDTAGDVDTINLMLDFDQLSFSRSGDDLVVENPDASFSLSVSNYMSGADGSDQYRHLNFLSRDKVAFTLVADQVVPTGSSRLKPSITGLDFSSETVSRIIDLRKPSQDFGFASMAVSSFVGSSTAATTVTTGNLDTLVATGSQGDTITTGQGQDTIRSGAGNDQIMADRGDDMIFAGTGADRVDAGEGNDVLVGGAGADYLYGGSGTDTLMFIGDVENETGVTVNLSTGKGQGADAAGDVYVSIENVYGTDYDDILIGNAQANLLSGGRGTNTLSGHGGNDIFMIGNDSSNTVDGGDGTDLIRYTDMDGGVQVDLSDLSGGRTVHLDARGNATTFVDTLSSIEDVEGSAHRDLITGDAQSNRVLGSMGEDVIDLGAGQDVVDYRSLAFDGNEGIWVDLLHGLPEVEAGDGALSDYLVQMLSHVEAVFGSRANDRIYGSNASDVLAGYKGLDILRGRGGDDTFLAWGDGDAFHGGSGSDTVDYRNMAEGVTASLNTGHGNGLDDFFDIENLSGTLFNDVLEGDNSANTLYGSLGLDELRGLGGDDTLMGIGDGDILDGGAGNDTVTYAQATQGIWATMGLAPLDVDQRRHWENQGNGSRRPDYICGVENLVGSAHGDLVQTSAGADTLDMGDGNDWIVGSRGSDAITGGDGTDSLSYTGADLDTGVDINLSTHRVTGRSGAAFTDTLTGIERVQGSENDDVITGSTTGNDYIFASQGQDRIDAQTATVVDFSRMYTDQGITLSSETDGYTIAFDVQEESSSTRITGAATVKGSSQNDTFNGGAAADVFEGGLGNDTLSGGTGADTLKGGNGNDTLDGGTGSDTLDGGAGDDTYTFERGDGSVSITDAAGSDTLDLKWYSVNEIAFWMDGNDLLISAGEDNLRIHDQVSDSGSAIDRIRLSNGRELTAQEMADRVPPSPAPDSGAGAQLAPEGTRSLSASNISNLVSAMAQLRERNSIENVSSAQDVRNNDSLMSLAVSAWQ